MTTNTSSLYRLVLGVKDLCLFSELTELPLKLQLCWVGATYEADTASALGLWLVDLLPRLKPWCGSFLVPGWIQLPLVPCSVGWHLDKGPQTVGLLPAILWV